MNDNLLAVILAGALGVASLLLFWTGERRPIRHQHGPGCSHGEQRPEPPILPGADEIDRSWQTRPPAPPPVPQGSQRPE